MKKITQVARMLIVLLSVFLLSAGAWAQTNLLVEGFEGGSLPAGWSQNFVSGTTAWTYQTGGNSGNPATAHTGTKNAYLFRAAYNQCKTELITPVIDFTGFSAARVVFWQARGYWAGDIDSLCVLYRNTTTGPWKKINLFTNIMNVWTQSTLTIPAVSATTQLCFRGCAEWGYGVCLDDIAVQGLSYGTVSGIVKSSYTPFAPIQTATVVMTPAGGTQTTGAPGTYSFTNQLAGDYTICVSAPNFITQCKTVTVIGNQTVTLNFNLDPVPGTVTGIVTSCETGLPIVGAKITFGTGTSAPKTYSVAGGLFTLPVYPAGTAKINATKPGFDAYQSPSTISVTPPGTVSFSFCMHEAVNNPATPFTATLNTAQTAVNLQWGAPVGQYMLIYDDGINENWTVWATSGNMNATKFTPISYPATVTGGTLNIGTINNYPTGANPLVPFKIRIYDASGTNGAPGAQLAEQDVTPTGYGWVDPVFTLTTPITINSGSFYIAMVQGGNAPNAAGLAIDTTTQQLRSYSKFGSGPWIPASGNFLIRAIISGSGGPLLADNVAPGKTPIVASFNPNAIYLTRPSTVTGFEGKGTVIPLGDDPESVIGYQVWRLLQGQEGNEALWIPIGTPTATNMVDNGWPSLACGPYKWAVKAQYTGNRWSSAIFSNIIEKCWRANVTVNFDLSCDSTELINTYLELRETTLDSVYTHLTTDNSPTYTFTNVWKGTYVLKVVHFGYAPFQSPPTAIMGDYTFNATLLETKWAPTGLTVNNRSLLATWNAPVPMIEQFKETFASGNFTTNQWVVDGANWAVNSGTGNPAPSARFSWTPSVTNYTQTVTSKSIAGLHAPVQKLKYDVMLDNYGTTNLNQLAVELWDGTTWHLLKNYDNSSGSNIPWTTEVLDITDYTHINFKIRFRAYGENSVDIDYWYFDNVYVYSTTPPGPDPCLLGYNFYLNTVLDAFLTDTSYVIPPSHVIYNKPYNACVLAVYGSGFSATSCYSFISKFLYPPTDIDAEAIEDAAYITWKKPVVYADGPSLISAVPRTEFPVSSTEYSPMVIKKNINYTDALWTVLFTWNTSPASGAGAGQAGIENDENYVYTSVWGGINTGPPWFYKYQKATGAVVESFNITGATAVRDMATDGQYFYGSAAGTAIYKMDFVTKTLVATINTSIAGIRHIAYDPNANGGAGGLWCGAWATMNLVSMTGSTIAANVITVADLYGCAFEQMTPNGPHLWTFDQGGNGATLTQYKVTGSTLTATGVTKDASTLPGFDPANGIAGGLSAGKVGDKLALIGLVQQQPNLVFAYEIGDWSGGGGGTPPGLQGYKVYRDEAFIHYVPHPDTLFYYDMHLYPGNYCYDVSAWYKLDPYGLIGQFDESLMAPNGPACVNIMYGYPIPFMEPWDGSTGFAFHEWTFGSNGQGNWTINNALGNPAPSADFNWQPIHANYDYSLESPILDASAWTCATIWLDFDYKLADRNENSKEKLTIEYSLMGGPWKNIDEFINDGSVDWTAKHYEIPNAKGKALQIRFRANGTSTDNILHWYVDNIHVYGICNPPTDLIVDIYDMQSHLTWNAPVCGGGGGQIMDFIFDDGTGENGWAINPGYTAWLGTEFPIASTMSGVIQQFSVYFQANAGAGADQLTIEVYDGTQTLVGETDPFTPPTDAWLDFAVNDIPFDGMFYAMVKWDMEGDNTNYLSIDEDGPYAAQDLEWYYDGTTWDKIWIAAGSGNPGVFMIRAKALVSGDLKQVVLTPGQPFVPANTTPSPEKFSSSGRSVDTHNYGTMDITSVADSSTLTGYNVYWNETPEQSNTFLLVNDAPVTTTSYIHELPGSVVIGQNVAYFVTALFENSQAPAPPYLCEPSSDTVLVVVGNIKDLTAGGISIYPNPANEVVNIASTNDINTIEVINYIGQTVYTNKNVANKQMQLNVTSYKAGVYFVKITTATGIKTTKITVTH